jgi:RNA polymerase sigma-70 factor (ECF subfamily)
MNDISFRERISSVMRLTQASSTEERSEITDTATHPKTFEEIFLKHWTVIYQLLIRLTGDPSEAEDLAMETFMRLYQRPPKLGEGSNLPGWLYRVATNLGLRSIRSYRRRQHYELAAGKMTLEDPPENQPARLLDSQEAHNLTRQALSQMRPRHAQLLSLRYSGMSYQDVASTMGLSPTSIGPLLLRAEREFTRIYRSISKEEL